MSSMKFAARFVLASSAAFVTGCSSTDEDLAGRDRRISDLQGDNDSLQRQLDQQKSVQMVAQTQLADERRKVAELEEKRTAPPKPEDPVAEFDTRGGIPAAKPTRPAGPVVRIKDEHVETEARGDSATMFRLKGAATFAAGSTKLTKDGLDAVDKIAAELKKSKGRISVEGHTDATPLTGANKETYGNNLNLSLARAVAVKERIVEVGKISPDRIAVVGHGDGRPLAKGATKDAHARNRRVEIVLTND